MTATVIPITSARISGRFAAVADAATENEYIGWRLTLYETHHAANGGRTLTAFTAQELLQSYTEPRLLAADASFDSAKALKDASPCVTAALMRDGVRKHDAAGLSRVLFVDFDRGADSAEGVPAVERDGLLCALKQLDKAFVLHTTSSTPWLSGGRSKLRAVMPLFEAVDVAGYKRMWTLVTEHVERTTGLRADSTKKHPGDLFYLPVWHPSRLDSWWSRCSEGSSLLWDLPLAATGLTDDRGYERLRTAKPGTKNDTLFRVAYGLGRFSAVAQGLSGDTLDAHITEHVWPELRRGLEDNPAATGGEPVKDWSAAERTVRQKFAAGLADAAKERDSKVSLRRAELLSELRAAAGFEKLLSVSKANGRNFTAARDTLRRLGSLVAAELGMPADEHTAIKERVLRAIDANTTAAKAKLSTAWSEGLASAVDPAQELRAAEARVGWQELGLILGSKSGLPEACATNVELLFMKDPLLRSMFARNVRSVSNEFVVQRDHTATGLVAGQAIALANFEGFEWFRNYVAKTCRMHDLERREYDAGLAAAANSLPIVDPLVRYFEELPAVGPTASEALESFFVRHGGVPDTELIRAITRAFFVSAVRTVYEPGAKTSLVWVMISTQGKGKTLVLEALCPDESYCGKISPNEIGDGRNSDSGRKPVQTAGRCWLIEVPELKLRGDYVEDWKGFISDFNPAIRLPYSRGIQVVPRRGILVATTNNRDLFKDPTGNRRFPVLDFTKLMVLEDISAERDMLWAEALRLYRLAPADSGIPEHLWAAAAAQAEEYMDVDHVEDQVRGLTDGSYTWPVACEQGSYSPLVGLCEQYATKNDVPRVLSLSQWVDITGCKQQSKLTAALRRVGWKPLKCRAFFQDGRETRLWVHPSFQ